MPDAEEIKFKVGDLVTETDEWHKFSEWNSLMEVISIRNRDYMYVKILRDFKDKACEGKYMHAAQNLYRIAEFKDLIKYDQRSDL